MIGKCGGSSETPTRPAILGKYCILLFIAASCILVPPRMACHFSARTLPPTVFVGTVFVEAEFDSDVSMYVCMSVCLVCVCVYLFLCDIIRAGLLYA